MDDQTLHHFMEDLTTLVTTTAFILATTWLIGSFIKAFRDKANYKARTALYNQLLEKFDSATEFVDYLQTETGRQFMEDLTIKTTTPIHRIFGSIQKGIAMALCGFGLLVLGNLFDKTFPPSLFNVIVISGTVISMLGIGFLIATGISYRLSKSWGLFNTKVKTTESEQINKI